MLLGDKTSSYIIFISLLLQRLTFPIYPPELRIFNLCSSFGVEEGGGASVVLINSGKNYRQILRSDVNKDHNTKIQLSLFIHLEGALQFL